MTVLRDAETSAALALRSPPACRATISEMDSDKVTGSLREYMAHECLKSSLAFHKPAMAVVSRHPARTEGL